MVRLIRITTLTLYPFYSWFMIFAYKRMEGSLGGFKQGARLPECSLASMKEGLGDMQSFFRCVFLTLKSVF